MHFYWYNNHGFYFNNKAVRLYTHCRFHKNDEAAVRIFTTHFALITDFVCVCGGFPLLVT